jgi:sugar/nucleoside kinase (ribokinase family)
MARAASFANIFFISESLCRQLTQHTSLKDSLRQFHEWGVATVVCALRDGDICCFSSDVILTVHREFHPKVNGTLGAGDIFGGWFLAEFLRPPQQQEVVPEKLDACIRSGMAAVAWRLEQRGIEVPTPDPVVVAQWLQTKRFQSYCEHI